MRLAVEGDHMVFTHRIEFDILDDNHLFVLLLESRRQQNLFRILRITLRQEAHRFGHPFRGFQQPFTIGILSQKFQNSTIMFR